jgi:hypothetical protein
MTAPPDCGSTRNAEGGPPKTLWDRLVNAFSFVTMAMTVPQAVNAWRGSVEGVSVISWAAYLVSACLWLVYGLRKHNKTIWVPCLGWIALDVAIVLGIVVRG